MSTIEQLALRCLMPGFVGTSVPDWVRRRAADGLGGVVLFARNVDNRSQVAALTAELHAERRDLLIAIDEEGGDVTRLEAANGSSYPGNRALGVVDDRKLTFDVARSIGAELAAAGIDLDLAPDADVNSNPLNPVIGVRSFGSDPAAVSAHVAAFVSGLQSAGVAACAKHFPGHGDVSVDSHLARAVTNADPHQGALEPFKAAISSGAEAIMSAHIVARAIDDVPATISHRVMTALLREELGFRGLAITDGLEMHGLSDGLGVGEGAVLALVAGCDALCVGGGLAGEEIVDEIASALVRAVHTGRLPEARLAAAAARVDVVAQWRAAQPAPPAPNREIGLAAARRALIADGPVRAGDAAVVVQLEPAPSMAAGRVPWGVAIALADRGVQVTSLEFDGSVLDVAQVAREAAQKSLVVVVRDLHRCAANVETVDGLLNARPDAIVVEMGLPTFRPQRARAYIATNGSARVCGEAAAEVMV